MDAGIGSDRLIQHSSRIPNVFLGFQARSIYYELVSRLISVEILLAHYLRRECQAVVIKQESENSSIIHLKRLSSFADDVCSYKANLQ